MAINPGNIINGINLCQDIHSAVFQVQRTFYDNLKQQCEKLCHELRIIKRILEELEDTINGNTDPRNSERGLLDAIQNANAHLRELLDAVSGVCLKKCQIRKRRKLRKFILKKTQSLHEARELVESAVVISQLRLLHRSCSNVAINTVNDITGNSEDTVTDGSDSETDESEGSGSETDESEGQETTENEINEWVEETNEPPRFKEILGIIQPHDVITFKNQIFILMDGGINAYDMEGNRIKLYREDGFKPFAGTFLGNTLFVTDKKSKCVIKFDESLNVKQRFGTHNMIEPAGITSCERENCIFVLTGKNRESAVVAKFTSDGEYKRCYCSNRLENPWYIKKSSSDEFFISDFARMAVDVYSYDFSNRLCTVDTKMHCRGMDIDDVGNIYISRREPGYKAQYEDFGCYSRPTRGWVTIEESPKPWFWQNQNKSLDFVRGLHYYRCQDEKFLMVVDPGNKRLKVISL